MPQAARCIAESAAKVFATGDVLSRFTDKAKMTEPGLGAYLRSIPRNLESSLTFDEGI
jgi:hypothetical protein